MHRGKEFYALSKIGPYTFADYIVAARDNSKFCASVIKKETTPWNEEKQVICVKHTIIISQDKKNRFINEDEAYYICGILNSEIVQQYIQTTFKSNGFSLNKSNLYMPLYDQNNKNHRRQYMNKYGLSHTQWKCQYHVIFIPKYRQKVLYGTIRADIRKIIRKLCAYKKVEIIEGAVCIDHVLSLLYV